MDAAEMVEEKKSEDWCFICKDGGDLMLCDYKDCPKVYHSFCLEKDFSVRENQEPLICQWHSCYLCNKRPMLYCLCCPHSVCKGCVTHAEFIQLKEDKGLCNQCQEYVFALEEIRKYNAAADKIDLTDHNTFECLFLECWEIVKKQEGVTFDDVRASKSRKKVVKLRHKVGSKDLLNDAHSSKPQKRGVKLKGVGESRREFIGWGSKPLIDFLKSIGEDTRNAMSQHSVESVIQKYILRKNLLDREKKKKVRCDRMLYSIFRKTSVNRKKIYRLLSDHLKENLRPLEHHTRLEHGFREKNEKALVPCKMQRMESSDEKACEKEMKPELRPAETCDKEPRLEMQTPETCEKEVRPEMRATGLATINADNINLVYLRKSLVLELSKQNENFGEKVVGSFVKLKNGPKDRIAYQILQVTGIETANDQSEGVLLYVAGVGTAVSISKLDDSDLAKEEIEDLKQKVVRGLLRQPTVVEMEQKAKSLHEDITKHWIARQLIVLQKRITFANEKGWRKQLDEYLEQRELLQKPLEQERLLRKTPRIVEEFIEVKREAAVFSSVSSKEEIISGLSQVAAIDIN